MDLHLLHDNYFSVINGRSGKTYRQVLASLQQTEFTQIPIVYVAKNLMSIRHIDYIVRDISLTFHYSYMRFKEFNYQINEVPWSCVSIGSYYFRGRRVLPFFDHNCFATPEDRRWYLARPDIKDLILVDAFCLASEKESFELQDWEIDFALKDLDSL
jgi:hypothetical protein